LVTTRGFRDALRIAYQNRPRLFDRHIVLPELLYSEVVEAQERMSAQGDVLETLVSAAWPLCSCMPIAINNMKPWPQT
jgi:5-oxoprolinase (ATP-hydrolysing)